MDASYSLNFLLLQPLYRLVRHAPARSMNAQDRIRIATIHPPHPEQAEDHGC